jgi:predicted lipoprotein with Yx(FWY)xxD motif
MTRTHLSALALVASVALVSPVAAAAQGTAAPSVSAGNGIIYTGGYPHTLYTIDEATEKVVGTIDLKGGTPRSMVLSPDKKKFYVLNNYYEKLEIVDLPSKKSVDVHTISEGGTKARWMAYAIAPSGDYAVVYLKAATKQIDRFVIEPPKLVVYDFKERRVTRTIAWPDDEPQERANLIFSPDGKYLYLFGAETVIYDATNFTQVEKWEVTKQLEDGYGRLDMGPMDTRNDDPGFHTGIFTMQDPVQKRQMLGIGRIDLVGRKLDFTAIGPANVQLRSFWLAPDRKRAYALRQDIGEYEFWTFDLVNKKVESRTPFAGRPRMDVGVSTNGNVLYIFTAGHTIDLYDAKTYKRLRTIELDGDMETPLFVMPAPATEAPARTSARASAAGAP